jgi:hypothetical protein
MARSERPDPKYRPPHSARTIRRHTARLAKDLNADILRMAGIVKMLRSGASRYSWAEEHGYFTSPTPMAIEDDPPEKVKVMGDPGGPTAAAAVEQVRQSVRQAMEEAAVHLADAEASLKGFHTVLDGVNRLFSPHREPSNEVFQPPWSDSDSYISSADFAAARQAKKRRQSRDEGWGRG